MKNHLLIICLFIGVVGFSQNVSMKITQFNYSSIDPDGAGPATGSVVFQFELMSDVPVLADGMGLSFVYQSSKLIPAASPAVVKVGALASASGWNPGIALYDEDVTGDGLVYGGQSFDKRMFAAFSQFAAISNLNIGTSWMPVAQVTYWTIGTSAPEGGYATPQSGSILAQIELSTQSGGVGIPMLSPGLNIPLPLGSGTTLPVLFTNYEVNCNDKGTSLTWTTATEINSDHFEIQKNVNGTWTTIDRITAAGNSSESHKYQYLDLEAGVAQYRIRQVDLDGKSVYTNVRYASCENNNKNSNVVMYPVPVRNVLNIAIRTDKAIHTELQVLDMSGRIVKRQAASLNSGNSNLSISVDNLSSGEYIIRSSNGTLKLNQKFTIVR